MGDFKFIEANIMNTPRPCKSIDYVIYLNGRKVGYVLCGSNWASAYNLNDDCVMNTGSLTDDYSPVHILLEKLNTTPHF